MLEIRTSRKPKTNFSISINAVKKSRNEFIGISKKERGQEIAIHLITPEGTTTFSRRVLLAKGYGQIRFEKDLTKFITSNPKKFTMTPEDDRLDFKIEFAISDFLNNLKKREKPKILDHNSIV